MVLSSDASGSKNAMKPQYARKKLSLTISITNMEHDVCRVSDDQFEEEEDEFWVPRYDYLTVVNGSSGHKRNKAISSDIFQLLETMESGSSWSQGSEYETIEIHR